MNEMDLLKGLNEVDDGFVDEASVIRPRKTRRKSLLRWISVAAVLFLVFPFILPMGNGNLNVRAESLMEGITPRPVEVTPPEGGTASVLDFSARLVTKANKAGENTLISPISALYALSMTANGAKGDTLAEMESVLGMSVAELNAWLYNYGRTLDSKELNVANSVWFTNRKEFTLNRDFLQNNADYYGADIYQAAFDASTAEDINRWVSHKTDGMIPMIVDDVEGMLTVLVNALCFEAEWRNKYVDDNIRPDTFTREDGTKVTVDFMHSQEDYFLQDEGAKGFVKYYEGGRYAFLAMLPNEGITVEQYLSNLTGEGLQRILDSAENMDVTVAMPKFETDFSVDLIEPLRQMGMQAAFDGSRADFSGMGSYANENIFISVVKQKTYICVDEKGTKAAASTLVGSEPTSAPVMRVERVILDRPFVYLLMDMQTGIPLFIGSMMDPKQ